MAKYKTSICRDFSQYGCCPRGYNCTFAHSTAELELHRSGVKTKTARVNPFSSKISVTQSKQSQNSWLESNNPSKVESKENENLFSDKEFQIEDNTADFQEIGSAAFSASHTSTHYGRQFIHRSTHCR